MLKLDKHITINEDLIQSVNLTDRFAVDDLRRIGDHVWQGYARDLQSRTKWENRTSAAMDLAMQVQKEKTFPWPGCSNIAFPLVTIAAMQFHSIAYPSIIQGTEIVKARPIGPDPQGQKRARADRVACHMSYQVMEEDKGWEEQHDRLLINLAIVGCAFKKSYYSPSRGHNTSELVLARDLVVHYYANSLESCARKTHVMPLYRNEIHERVLRGTFHNVLEEAWYNSIQAPPTGTQSANTDNRMGSIPPNPDEDTPFLSLEQHCSLDLDGDGYAEPYIVTIDSVSKQVLRIVTRFERMEDVEKVGTKIARIRSSEYFTKYSFIPAPDGGIYDMGFGVLLGPLNESVSSLVNQLADAGTISNTAGGFLGRGAKIRGGVYSFAPLEWKRVDSSGDDIRKSLIPLPVREPSMVLFQLLSLLINYTNRISGSVDATVGENPGQNTPAETSRNMVQQGMKVYNVIFKRVWRSMKEEFKKLYILNAIYMDTKKEFGNGGAYVLREDYLGDPDSVVPAADPNLVSDSSRFAQAQAIRQAALQTPGYNLEAVERNFLKALHIEEAELFYPGPQKVPPLPNPKMMVEQLKQETKKLQLQQEMQMFVAELIETRQVNQAQIMKLQAEAMALIEGIGAEKAKLQLEAFNSSIKALQAHDDALKGRIELLLKGMEHERENSNAGGMAGMAKPPSNQGALQPSPQMGGGIEGPMG